MPISSLQPPEMTRRRQRHWNVRAPALRPLSKQRVPHGRLEHERRRQQIIADSLRYFSIYGFNGGTRQLAKHLGVSQSLFYHYFKSKEDLIRSVNQHAMDERLKRNWTLISHRRDSTPQERIVAFYRKYLSEVANEEWTRFSILSALSNWDLHDRNFDSVRTHVFPWLVHELRGLAGPRRVLEELTDLELEVAWQMHTAFFYLCVREYVFKVPGA